MLYLTINFSKEFQFTFVMSALILYSVSHDLFLPILSLALQVDRGEDEMYDGPDGLITGGDEGDDESMKRLLLKQSEKANNEVEVYSGGMSGGNDMTAKVKTVSCS